ncbi:MAG TPA: type IV secretory system conjugative DNA transfer family protein, partial [Acidimicrobiales bacterium]|nr:type IV secretory system conjugative DNA transfer family protein [Acidimicrobiales bacterium]
MSGVPMIDNPQDIPQDALEEMREGASNSGGIYLGAGLCGPVWSGRERSVLVLGPPRSGKTTSLIIPAVLTAPGAVVSTSTKPDVLSATAGSRSRQGPILLYDPSGTIEVPLGVEPVRWSPVASCSEWDAALVVSRSLVQSARGRSSGTSRGSGIADDHWTERAQSLLAPLLHAAAIEG